MVAFAFVHYDPKPSKISIRKPSSKPNKNLVIDSSSVPVEALPALEGAAGKDNWCQKVVGHSVATIQGAQVCRDHVVGTQALIAEKDGFDNDTDNEFPSLKRLPSSGYKFESADEKSSVESTVGQGDDQALEDSLGSRGPRAGCSNNEPFVLHSDDESEDDNNFDSGPARCIVEGGQPGCDTFDMEHPPMLSIRATYEHGDGGIGINKTMSHQTMKRQRSNSPPSTSTSSSCDSITSLLPRNEDEEGSRELVSEAGESGDDICSKRRKVSTPQGRRTVSSNDPSQPSGTLSVGDEDSGEDDGTLSISLGARLTSFSKSPPASEVTSPTELDVCPMVTDVDQDWDVREIIGKEDLDGVTYYLVDWHPTLLPEHSLGHAKELVQKFEARIRAQRGVNHKRGGLGSKTRQKAGVKAKGKKARGRPRKQT